MNLGNLLEHLKVFKKFLNSEYLLRLKSTVLICCVGHNEENKVQDVMRITMTELK